MAAAAPVTSGVMAPMTRWPGSRRRLPSFGPSSSGTTGGDRAAAALALQSAGASDIVRGEGEEGCGALVVAVGAAVTKERPRFGGRASLNPVPSRGRRSFFRAAPAGEEPQAQVLTSTENEFSGLVALSNQESSAFGPRVFDPLF
jgi:hypothetical protein